MNLDLNAVLKLNIAQFMQGMSHAASGMKGINNLQKQQAANEKATERELEKRYRLDQQILKLQQQQLKLQHQFQQGQINGTQFAQQRANIQQQISLAQQRLNTLTQVGNANNIQGMVAWTAGLVGALYVLNQLKDTLFGITKELIDQAAQWERMKIGMATLLMGANEFSSATQGQLDKQEQFNRALLVSDKLMQELRVDAMKNVGTTQDLVGIFKGLQMAVAGSSKANENYIEKTRVLSNQVMIAANALGPEVLRGGTTQAVREVNEILHDRITIINKFAQGIGLTKDEFKKLRREGMSAFDILETRMKLFGNARSVMANSFAGLSTTLKDMIQFAEQSIGKFGFERLEGFMRDIVGMFVKEMPDGTAKLTDGFQKFVSTLAPIFDELMIPLIGIGKQLVALVIENAPAIVMMIRLIVQVITLALNILQSMIPILRLIIDTVKPFLPFVQWVLGGIIALLNETFGWITNIASALSDQLKPALDFLNLGLNKSNESFQGFLGNLNQSTELTVKMHQAQKDHEKFLDTKMKNTMAGTTDELNKQNKAVQDNTQHWRNWVSVLKAAYEHRVPELAHSFMTTFGRGTISPGGSAGTMPVNINIHTANGMTTIPAHMTPQQLAQARTQTIQRTQTMANYQRAVNTNPSSRAYVHQQ